MGYAKPIWNEVTNCKYKSSKSYGNIDTGEVKISVGSSAQNSHELVRHYTTRRLKAEYKGLFNVWVFKFGVNIDNTHQFLLVEKIFKNVNGRASDLIKTNKVSKNFKGLKTT